MSDIDEFEKWAKTNTQLSLEKLGNFYVYANTTAAKLGFMARQPEIDALGELNTRLDKENTGLLAVVDALRAELEVLRDDRPLSKQLYFGVCRERDALRAENERLRKDAERYRKLRKYREVLLLTGFFGNGCVNRTLEEVDAELDAMKETK